MSIIISCVFLVNINCKLIGQSCVSPDVNCSGGVGIDDLLILLSYFGEVDSDLDGVWDSDDPCFGVLDACGECNGLGPQYLIFQSTVLIYDSVYIASQGEWQTFYLGEDSIFIATCDEPGCTDSLATNFSAAAVLDDGSCEYLTGDSNYCQNSTFSYHGYDYAIGDINGSCWLFENLRTQLFSNGDTITSNLPLNLIGTTNAGAFVEGVSVIDNGFLYNGHALLDDRGLCPSGWRIPNSNDWEALALDLGPSTAALALKSSPSDLIPWDGQNTSGFEARHAGWRWHMFNGIVGYGSIARFWSMPSGSDNQSSTFGMATGVDEIQLFENSIQDYLTVRCISQDSSTPGCLDSLASNFNPQALVSDGSCTYGACGDVNQIQYEGEIYSLVSIGEQCWFSENLKYLPSVFPPAPGASSNSDPRFFVYGYQGTDVEEAKNELTYEVFGVLYNFYAVSSLELCPSGWHVPTDLEWMQLEAFAGLDLEGLDLWTWRNNLGLKDLRDLSMGGEDDLGFGAMAGGAMESFGGGFVHLSEYGYFWTSTAHSSGGGVIRGLGSLGSGDILRVQFDGHKGYSVRCVKEE